MKKFLSLPLFIFALMACNSNKQMTEDEIKLINSNKANVPFEVLLTTDKQDSLFLRQKSIDIDVKNIAKDKDFQHFIKRMRATLTEEEGVGLAAPQVGIGRNVFLFMRVKEPEHPVQVAINPRIVNKSDETFCFAGDGCLSIPDQSGSTARHTWVEVEYYDETGKLIKERLNGGSRREDYTGVVFQHEFDHLNGILFIDRLVADKPESEADSE